MTIEATYGVPTVAVHTDKFDRVVRSVSVVNGMPGLRQVFVPQPIMGKTAAELYAYVDGLDPITGRPVMQEIVEGLTRPFEEAERGPLAFEVRRRGSSSRHRGNCKAIPRNRGTECCDVLPTEAR